MYQQTRPTNLPKSHNQTDIVVGIDPMVGPMACIAFTLDLITRWSVSEGLAKDTKSVHSVEVSRQ